ncbi:MAG: amino acid ABC transporter permease [Clostridiales bacterium]|nr:amino acid ABC transporter permease [Clostridiales bacterium]
MDISTMILELGKAFLKSVSIFSLTLLGSLPLGLVVYFLKKCKFPPVKWLTEIYISIMRGTPLMLQLMVVYFGPNLIFHMKISSNWRFSAVIVAFVINYSAYFAEIYRGGIESIPIGQYEAAQVLGYGKIKTFLKIILPQMIKRVLPPVTNEVITLVKDTSLASTIGIVEMFTKARQIAVSPNSPGMITFVAAAAFYYVFNFVVAFALKRIEKALDYYR